MRRDGAVRELTVDGTVWLWNVRHRHPDCRTVLTLRRAETRHAQLRLVFRDGPGRIVAGYPFGLGDVASAGGEILNLNKPGVVRRFLEEAGTRGLLPTAHGVREEDAWPLYDTLTEPDEAEGCPAGVSLPGVSLPGVSLPGVSLPGVSLPGVSCP